MNISENKSKALSQKNLLSELPNILKQNDPEKIVDWINTFHEQGFKGSSVLQDKFQKAGYYNFDMLEQTDPARHKMTIDNRNSNSRSKRAEYVITVALEYALSGNEDPDNYLGKWLNLYYTNKPQQNRTIIHSMETLKNTNFFDRVGDPDHDERDR